MDLRRILLFVVLLSASATPVHAQLEGWGVKAGVTSMTESAEDPLETDRNTGFVVGGTAQIGVAGPFSVRPELLFIRKGWSFRLGRSASTVNLDYLELPVLAAVELPAIRSLTPHLMAGPTFGVKVHESINLDPEPDHAVGPAQDSISDTEVAFAVGVGASGEVVRFDVRYQISLTNVNELRPVQPDGTRSDSPPMTRNRGLSVTLGLMF